MHRAAAAATWTFRGGMTRPETGARLRCLALAARRPKTMDEWREYRAKEGASSSSRGRADDELSRRAARWALAVGAEASALDGFSPTRRREFLDEWERENPPAAPAPSPDVADDATAVADDTAAAPVDARWEQRVQFDALRDGDAWRQHANLRKSLKREG